MLSHHLCVFAEVSVGIFCAFLSWVVCFPIYSFKHSLCILDTSSLLAVQCARILSQPVACLSTLLALFAAERLQLCFENMWEHRMTHVTSPFLNLTGPNAVSEVPTFDYSSLPHLSLVFLPGFSCWYNVLNTWQLELRRGFYVKVLYAASWGQQNERDILKISWTYF